MVQILNCEEGACDCLYCRPDLYFWDIYETFMSEEQASAINEFAQRIFLTFTGDLGYHHWDWEPAAKTSMDAAEVYFKIFAQRFERQTNVPIELPLKAQSSPYPPSNPGPETDFVPPVQEQ